MSESAGSTSAWWDRLEQMNEEYLATAERTVAAQNRMVDAWMKSMDAAVEQDRIDEDYEAAYRAYDIWTQAVNDTVEQLSDLAEGEDVPLERFRDTWLNAANRAFKNAMGTSMFAQATGLTIDEAMDLRRQADELAEATLHDLGLPTEGDIEEVGERLVELERRQHSVEQRLDRIIESLESGA
jgi:hypothetical protein